MALPAKKVISAQQAAQAAKAQGPAVIRLKKGELLFAEGETSKAMYFLKSGMIRIFKKKGSSFIELDTIRSGQILGELAFLDGQPRSASGEALTNCELVEVSGSIFAQTMAKMPDWLKLLLKTIVGRLRASSTRIRQLEQASVSFDYSAKDGKRAANYVYLNATDVLKICSALLLVTVRNGTKSNKGTKIRVGLLQRYANQIMGIPVAKITTMLDTLESVGIILISGEENNDVTVVDVDFLEKFISYYNEENLLPPSKQHNMNLRSFLIMSLIAKNIDKYPVDEVTGMNEVNLAEIQKIETVESTGREPFRIDETVDLVRLGYCTNPIVKSAEEAFSKIKADTFMVAYRMQRLIKAIDAVNEEKRSQK